MRYLGVDFGLKKIGLALGDGETKITTPLEVIAYENAEKTLSRLMVGEGIDVIVIGKPEHMKKVEQEEARLSFVTFLQTLKPVYEIDERYTTKESRAMQAEGDGGKEDALAAQLILDSYFAEPGNTYV